MKKAKEAMPPLMLIVIGAAGIILFIAVGSFTSTRRSLFTDDEFRESKYPYGFYRSVGIAACIALGILTGLFMGNVPIGAAVGIGFGLVVGPFLEKRLNGDAGPLTEPEKQERLNRRGVGLMAMYILVLVTLLCAFLQWTR